MYRLNVGMVAENTLYRVSGADASPRTIRAVFEYNVNSSLYRKRCRCGSPPLYEIGLRVRIS